MIEDDGMEADAPDHRLLEDLAPEAVLVALARANPGSAIAAEDESELVRATAPRRMMFAAGRELARELARSIGVTLGGVPNDPGGAPVWPSGIVGSFSYKERWCAVALSTNPRYRGLGIDLDRVRRLPSDSWDGICNAQERMQVSGVSPAVAVHLLFSAKEAYFKAQYAVTANRDLEMTDITVQISPQGRISVLPELGGVRCWGVVALSGGWCAACVALEGTRILFDNRT